MTAGGKSPWQQTVRSRAVFFKLQQTKVKWCLSLFSLQCGRQWLQEMTLLRWGTQALESLCHQMAQVTGTCWLLPCYMHVGIILCVCVCVCLSWTPSATPTLQGAHGDRCGAGCRTVDGVGHFGVLLALKRHLVLAQLVAVHPAVWAKPKECKQHVRTGTSGSLTSTNWLLLTSLWTLSVLQMQLWELCMLTVRQTNSSQIFWGTGEGEKLWFWLQTLFFFHVLQGSASCVQHRKPHYTFLR